jgi:hypothetical protein
MGVLAVQPVRGSALPCLRLLDVASIDELWK